MKLSAMMGSWEKANRFAHRVTVSDALRFALLAPGIVQAALDGTLPRTMTLEILQRRAIPLDWAGKG